MFNEAPVRRTVLYVEDNEVNAILMQAMFERRADLQLLVAPTCAAALRSAWASPPDLLLLDLNLPDGHGTTLLLHLRNLGGLQRVPAVAVSAEDLPAHPGHGFDDQWPKPLNLAQVLHQLERWLPARPGAPAPKPGPARR